ncbi:unnamed protein product [Leptidea sinapis]|uniref:RING-type domain-containing protein n=2 Tax=Leptidea sinapis TaxID=189913 RepID=A0A5E4R5X1_9NEOP|nr:unnamed protein product [Leptidea sinapis]
MNQVNINDASDCVQTIVKNCRCVICDQLHGKRFRYACGHSSCESCLLDYEFCMLCLTPSPEKPVLDSPQTERVRHASELFDTFQDVFKIDVYKRQRISDQLKKEKDIFPECIQAPIKYFNKRKSSVKDKENLSYIPGEGVGNMEKHKAEKSINYVQKWLCKNEKNFQKNKSPRKPFSDLNINEHVMCTSTPKSVVARKRSFFDSAFCDDFDTDVVSKKSKKDKKTPTNSDSLLSKQLSLAESKKKKCVTDDEIIVIKDSPKEIIDKDRLALLAVIEAEKHENNTKDGNKNISGHIKRNVNLKNKCCVEPISTNFKVPFYKKSLIVDTCCLCRKSTVQNVNVTKAFNDVHVTINNNSFLTTIKVSEYKAPTSKQIGAKKDVSVQMDTHTSKSNNIPLGENEATTKNSPSQDLFKDDINIFSTHNERKGILEIDEVKISKQNIVISDSDTDSYKNDGNHVIEVTADIHRSCELEDDYYTLKPLQPQEYKSRLRPPVRGKTPASSDSSDKENYDPNKKRPKFNKKKNKRKKL